MVQMDRVLAGAAVQHQRPFVAELDRLERVHLHQPRHSAAEQRRAVPAVRTLGIGHRVIRARAQDRQDGSRHIVLHRLQIAEVDHHQSATVDVVVRQAAFGDRRSGRVDDFVERSGRRGIADLQDIRAGAAIEDQRRADRSGAGVDLQRVIASQPLNQQPAQLRIMDRLS